jgi:hypothetical protein
MRCPPQNRPLHCVPGRPGQPAPGECPPRPPAGARRSTERCRAAPLAPSTLNQPPPTHQALEVLLLGAVRGEGQSAPAGSVSVLAPQVGSRDDVQPAEGQQTAEARCQLSPANACRRQGRRLERSRAAQSAHQRLQTSSALARSAGASDASTLARTSVPAASIVAAWESEG